MKDLPICSHRAHQIGKPRYVFLLGQGVFSAAYYTKTNSWAYELERRMLVRESEIKRVGELMLAEVPADCVSALLVGPRASEETRSLIEDWGSKSGCDAYRMNIGRSSANPYFVNSAGVPHLFDGKRLRVSHQYCQSCYEPLAVAAEMCSWCQIDDSHRGAAASRNPYRMLDQFGLLESYVRDMAAISRGGKK